MLFITLQTIPAFLTFSSHSLIPRLKPRQVPITRWALQVVVLTSSSLLNNWAYAYNVPLPVLIVFRSAGLAVSMLLGFFVLKRRYSIPQVLSVLSVSAGVVLSTLSHSSPSSHHHHDPSQFTTGIGMLLLSLLLTGFLGILQERTYQQYGPCWKEALFYTHFLSLPLFLFLISDIAQGYATLTQSTSTSTSLAYTILASNLFTQLFCVSGVSKLTSKVSSVSTNLVLTVRKAISLCFSVWWFGNGWNPQLGIGAAMVFFGSLMFTAASRSNQEQKDKKE